MYNLSNRVARHLNLSGIEDQRDYIKNLLNEFIDNHRESFLNDELAELAITQIIKMMNNSYKSGYDAAVTVLEYYEESHKNHGEDFED